MFNSVSSVRLCEYRTEKWQDIEKIIRNKYYLRENKNYFSFLPYFKFLK